MSPLNIQNPLADIATVKRAPRVQFRRAATAGAAVGVIHASRNLWSGPLTSPGELVDKGTIYSVTLDPEWTTPGAKIGLHFGSPADEITFRPGDAIEFPESSPAPEVWARNALGALVGENGLILPENKPFGYYRLIIGRAPGVRPLYARGDVTPRPEVCFIQQHELVAPGVDGVWNGGPVVVTSGLRALRVSIVPRAVDGAFTAKVRPYTMTMAGLANPPEPDSPTSFHQYVGGLGVMVDVTTLLPSRIGDLNATVDQLVFDVPVVAGAMAVGFKLIACNGGGYPGAPPLIIIEGY